ncbi:hypothetical protein EDB84DRAFT_823312 [Lactarius hengduanensis]|nr:hypothetical protein EDB84DRAFT_823312 [Lactarius hengduanensis]
MAVVGMPVAGISRLLSLLLLPSGSREGTQEATCIFSDGTVRSDLHVARHGSSVAFHFRIRGHAGHGRYEQRLLAPDKPRQVALWPQNDNRHKNARWPPSRKRLAF